MVMVIIKMNALSGKCLELKQALLALTEPMRKEKSCLSHHVLHDMESDNIFSLIQVWESREDLDEHWRSGRFNVLTGIRGLLNRPPEITTSGVLSPLKWEDVEAVSRIGKLGQFRVLD